ncbi:MAG: helicase HerA-like domain-containing protein, partial [Spirochaetota bacterium]
TELSVGQALVSFLDEDGKPGVVQRAYILPPHGQIGPITPQERTTIINNSPVKGIYENIIDRESAYEMLKARANKASVQITEEKTIKKSEPKTPGRKGDTVMEAMLKSAARTVGSTVGRQIVRGILGSLLGGKR